MTSLGDSATFHTLIYVPQAMVEMAKRLDEPPCAADAAADTRAVIEHLRAAIDQAAKLGQVWHAVERFDSGDGQGEIDVHEALAAYRGEETQP